MSIQQVAGRARRQAASLKTITVRQSVTAGQLRYEPVSQRDIALFRHLSGGVATINPSDFDHFAAVARLHGLSVAREVNITRWFIN